MQFFITNNYFERPVQSYPYFNLTYDSWDDFSNKTSFYLYYVPSRTVTTKIGSLKIMNIETRRTIELIERSFTELDENIYCSLGQDISYYENLKNILPDTYREVLDSLNDAATNQGIRDRFENTVQFKRSLLRWSEAEGTFRNALKILEGIPIDDPFKFTFKCQLDYASTEHSVDFNFKEESEIPNRIFGIIGKNGTGKTQYLSKLAVALSGQERSESNMSGFEPHRPPFTKVIAVSYSAFDKFKRPTSNRTFSYKYCGLRGDKGFLTRSKLTEIYSEAISKIEELDRQGQWRLVLEKIISKEIVSLYYSELFIQKNFEIFSKRGNGVLSSGQSILMYVITEIIANIKEDSLLLFDEPEMHLHPNAIANLIRMLHLLLEINNSYAIVATHSPIIIQEIPSDYVYVFERAEENTPIVRKLDVECFGENISAITQSIFDTIEVKGTYKDYFEKVAKTKTYEEVLKLFDGQLSFNASTYLKGIYNRKA